MSVNATSNKSELSTSISNKGNIFARAISWHFGNTKCSISEQQYEKEKYLISTVKFDPRILMPAAFLSQFGCGLVYSWSVFNTPIDESITGDRNSSQAPITFYIAIGMLGIAGAFSGPWIERNGPKKALLLASFAYFLGNLISALAIYVKYMWLLYIGFGIIGGFGIGLSYIAAMSSLQKWFPHRRGMAGAFVVGGFGGGSVALGKIILPLIELVGLPLSFVVLGTCFFVVMISCAFLFRFPPPNYSGDADSNTDMRDVPQRVIKITLMESVKSVEFLMLYVILFCNALFGFVIISRMSNMLVQFYLVNPDDAATIVSINGAANLVGRVFFAMISDKIGRKICFVFMLTAQTLIISTFPLYTERKIYWLFVLCMFITTICYGGGIGIIAAFVTDLFGAENISVCFGLIQTASSIFAAVIGGLTFTAIYNSQIASGWTTSDAYPYILNTYWILAFVIVGLLSAIFVKTSMKDRLLPPVNGEWFKFSLFGKIVRIKKVSSCPEVEIVSSKKFNEEWEEYLKWRCLTLRAQNDA